MMYRALTPAEESRFRQWARDTYRPGTEILGIWHPIVQDECVRINRQHALFVMDEEVAARDRP